MLKFAPSVRFNNNLVTMDDKQSSNSNSTVNSPRTGREKSEDKTDVISSDDSITVVEINRDDSMKISSDINTNDSSNKKEYSALNGNVSGHENKAFVNSEELTSGSSSGSRLYTSKLSVLYLHHALLNTAKRIALGTYKGQPFSIGTAPNNCSTNDT